jgi:myo-inositol-1(or 4)-monophosphatase
VASRPEPFEREVEIARRAAAAASACIARFARGSRKSWDKAADSPVTHADLAAHAAIERELRTAFPHDFVLSEESASHDARAGVERLWIVDPLDGTKEFIAGIPEYAVSIALVIAGEPVVGVVQNPISDECFWGARGRGAFLGSEPLRLSSTGILSEAVLLSSRTEQSRGQVDAWKGAVKEVRPIGSVALKLAWIAAGRGDVWLSMAPKNEWDVCAGHLLVREAGGIFLTRELGEPRYNQAELLMRPPMAAGPPALVEALGIRERAA